MTCAALSPAKPPRKVRRSRPWRTAGTRPARGYPALYPQARCGTNRRGRSRGAADQRSDGRSQSGGSGIAIHKPHLKPIPRCQSSIVAHGGGRSTELANRAGLAHITPYLLRYSFASTANDLGFTEPTIAAMLGHSYGTITGRYVHHLDHALIAAADRMAHRILVDMGESDPIPYRRSACRSPHDQPASSSAWCLTVTL